jgi:hypothetical protein
MILNWYWHFQRNDGLNQILRRHSIISTLFLQPTVYRFAFCFIFIFTARSRSTFISRTVETRQMLARHHTITVGEKVRSWLHGADVPARKSLVMLSEAYLHPKSMVCISIN